MNVAANSIPEILYHYCDIGAFMNIIATKSLWLTDSDATNDYAENKWIDNTIQKQMNDTIASQISDDGKEKARSIFQEIWDVYSVNRQPPFISCFSEAGDILSQWRSYSNNGTGFAIGFSGEYFKSMKIENAFPNRGAFKWWVCTGMQAIRYTGQAEELAVAAVLAQALLGVRSTIETAVMLNNFSYVFKNPAFSEEKEWRIIHTPMILMDKEGKKDPMLMGEIGPVCFRHTRDRIALYFTLKIDDPEITLPPIKEVMLGPRNTSRSVDIDIYLKHHGYKDVVVKHSSATYR